MTQSTKTAITARKFVLPALAAADSYKLGHDDQYVEGTEMVVSNWTPRSLEHFKSPVDPQTGMKLFDDKITWVGAQQLIHALVVSWDETFFKVDFEKAYEAFCARAVAFTGGRLPSRKRLFELHAYGRLPLTILSLPEGSRVNIRIPTMIIYNTQKWAYWVTNRIETFISAELWQVPTSATISSVYRTISEVYGRRTGCAPDFLNWQNHDFSPRGMSGMMAAANSGLGHLVYSFGTDNIPSVEKVAQIYRGDEGFIGGSIPATEHSVMTIGGEIGEFDLIKDIVVKVYDNGMVSVVCDQFDYWKVISEYFPRLKGEIIARLPDAFGMKKVVIRPDSGNPVKIVTGTVYYCTPEQENYTGKEALQKVLYEHKLVPYSSFDTHIYWKGVYISVSGKEILKEATPAMLGSAELLKRNFGSSVNECGFNVISSDVGLIYGDSITPERSLQIQHRLWQRKICTSVIVFGIGSYTYQYVTRDTLGQAVKATYAIVNGVGRSMQKKPKTDSGTKNSARGLLNVHKTEQGEWYLVEDAERLDDGEMKTILEDGVIVSDITYQEIRDTARAALMPFVETFFQ